MAQSTEMGPRGGGWFITANAAAAVETRNWPVCLCPETFFFIAPPLWFVKLSQNVFGKKHPIREREIQSHTKLQRLHLKTPWVTAGWVDCSKAPSSAVDKEMQQRLLGVRGPWRPRAPESGLGSAASFNRWNQSGSEIWAFVDTSNNGSCFVHSCNNEYLWI